MSYQWDCGDFGLLVSGPNETSMRPHNEEIRQGDCFIQNVPFAIGTSIIAAALPFLKQ